MLASFPPAPSASRTISDRGRAPRSPRRRRDVLHPSPLKQRKRHSDVVFAPMMRSGAMRRVDEILRRVAPKDITVTLIGESGCGKEVLARRVHELSARPAGPFIPINCAAIPDALFESELFGHERGAFTGANERVKGKI